jgi:hypothetical protein
MDKLNKLKSKALSESEILDIIDGKANVLTYSELEDIDDLDDALGKYGAFVLLYQTLSKNYGHWTCVFKVDDDTVEFFDSYGILVDDELNFVPEHFKNMNYKKFRHLTKLLYDSGYKVIYNEYPLQAESSSDEIINTCGRFVATRLALRDIPQQEFAKIFLKFDDPDLLVTYLTSEY